MGVEFDNQMSSTLLKKCLGFREEIFHKEFILIDNV